MSIGFSLLGAQILNPCCFCQKIRSCASHFLSPPWRVQPGETPLQHCPAPGRRPSVLLLPSSVLSPQSSVLSPQSSEYEYRIFTFRRLNPESVLFLSEDSFVCFVTLLALCSVFRPPWRVQPGETPLQDCPAPGRRPSVLGLRPCICPVFTGITVNE